MDHEFISTERFAIDAFALLRTPSWTRLEPQTKTGDPRPGIEARVHDPLWLLGRQWQLGEFAGEDAGTPLTVRVATRTVAVDRWAPGVDGAVQALDHAHQDLLEPWVEREPVEAGNPGPGLRPRAEAGAALLAALDDVTVGDVELGLRYRDVFVANRALVLDPQEHPDGAHAELDPAWLRLVRLLRGGAMADGELVAQDVEVAAPDLPAWLVPDSVAEDEALKRVIAPWLAWYRAEVSPLPGGDDAWIGERLEYQFRIGAGARAFDAPAHGGGVVDWHSFDASDEALAPPPDAPPDAPPADKPDIHALLASPLRYPGMPADRLWEMEDAEVNLGLVEAEPWDLARLLVAEFALTYGNDWLVVPVDVPFGSLTTVESVTYTTTFGERFVVASTSKVSADGHWRMFTVTTPDGASSDGLLVAPGAVAVQDGPAVEDVLFLRDEMANLAWAVERTVQGPSGAGRDRARERDDPSPPVEGPVDSAALDYELQSTMPARWIPYLPRASGYRAIELVQGAMPDADRVGIAPLGRLLKSSALKVIKDAEIPREGIVVRRQPSITRRADGSYLRWTTRRVGVGRGEGSSRLAFDSAVTRTPRRGA